MTAKGHEVRDRLARIEDRVRALESCADPAIREAARELVRALLDLHAAGLERALELLEPAHTSRLAADTLVGSLLLLHGLHPLPAFERVGAALARARLQLRALGGTAELISATEEHVQIHLGGDASAGPELRAAIEELIIDVVPDVASIVFEEDWGQSEDGRVPLPLLRGAK